jgi:hypothetical protein
MTVSLQSHDIAIFGKSLDTSCKLHMRDAPRSVSAAAMSFHASPLANQTRTPQPGWSAA